ncbi:hypothetical protein EDD15DRAFT_2402663 [Pisolithus albus]|nr:hypothetical protein EDD15DRAFT_2402663 [Pisolithus albus]
MSIRHPRDYTPAWFETEDPVPIDWTTVTDEELEPSLADSLEVELAKIDERAQRMRVRAQLRRQEEERLRRQQAEEKRQREVCLLDLTYNLAPDEHSKEEEERQRRELEERRRLAELEERRRLAENVAPIPRAQACALCVSTGTVCVDLPNSRRKQCAKCLHQKKGCRLPGNNAREKRKDHQVSPRGGDKRKRSKSATAADYDDDDHDIKFVDPPTAKAGTSAGAAPESIAQVLDRHLGEITTLLRDLVGKVDNFTGSTGNGEAGEAAETGDENRVTIATDDDAVEELTGNQAHWSPLKCV